LASQRYHVFGNLFVEPKDTNTASVRDLCLFIRGGGEGGGGGEEERNTDTKTIVHVSKYKSKRKSKLSFLVQYYVYSNISPPIIKTLINMFYLRFAS
jgi:hypothetical protein